MVGTELSEPAAAASWFKSINAEKAAEWTSALGSQLLHRGFMFVLWLIALFGFLRHGAWISNRLWTRPIASWATLESALREKWSARSAAP
jgi:hypothetical protein